MNERLTPLDPQGAHGIEHLLGVNGSKTNPECIELNPIRPVIDMSMGSHARIWDPTNERYNYQTFSLGIGASAHVEEWIISYGNHQVVGNTDMVYDLDHSLRIIAIDYQVHIQDIGGALDGRTYQIQLVLQRGINYVSVWKATHSLHNIAADPNSRYFNYHGEFTHETNWFDGESVHESHRWGSENQIRCPIIPATWGLKCYANVISAGALDPGHWFFPVESTVFVRILAQQVPHGAPIPGYWE